MAHGRPMRHRLELFLPIVVLALVMQILAPVAACWAATIAFVDPLQTASICHVGGGVGSGDQDRENLAHDGLCVVCVSYAGAAVDAPRTHAIPPQPGEVLIVRWPDASAISASDRVGSSSRARGPPLSA
ncbi:DUF2946 family protein [Bradyrhizobium sp. ISRA442]|uniref:DUF2946 family protein n=1 Tax=Bradyrhizobium sp. ISRA442 TaxID=2866197 RepID=UPI00404B1DF6